MSDHALPAPAQLNKDLPSDIRVPSSRPGRVHAESSATQRAFHYLLPLCWLAGAERAGAERVAEGTTAGAAGKFGVRRPAHAPRGDKSSDVTRRALRQLKTRCARRRNDGRVAQLRRSRAARPPVALRGGDLCRIVKPRISCAPFALVDFHAGGDAHAPPPRARRDDTIVVGGEPFVVVELRGRGLRRSRRDGSWAWPCSCSAASCRPTPSTCSREATRGSRRPCRRRSSTSPGARYSALEVKGGDAWPDDGDGADAWLSDLREDLVINANSDEWLRAFDSQALADAISAARRSGHDEAPASSEEVVVAATPPPKRPTPRASANCARRTTRAAGHEQVLLVRNLSGRRRPRRRSRVVERPPSQARGNAAFPKLADAVFDLERTIAPDRPPSTRCAVNRRAEFAPHVDSGRGLGQSTSLIVGLGDFSGGELCVEGVEHDVRYAPLQFDGWGERHWTLPFAGERYSLVWFTPAEAGARTSADARAAAVLGTRDFRYRENSSDALAILEVLGSECYAGAPPPFPGGRVYDFDPRGRAPSWTAARTSGLFPNGRKIMVRPRFWPSSPSRRTRRSTDRTTPASSSSRRPSRMVRTLCSSSRRTRGGTPSRT